MRREGRTARPAAGRRPPQELWEDLLRSPPPAWRESAQRRYRDALDRLDRGELAWYPYVPSGAGDRPAGFALYYDERGVGRRVDLVHLGRGHRTALHLSELLRGLESEDGGRIFGVSGFMPSIPPGEVAAAFVRRGFRPFERVRLGVDPRRVEAVPFPPGVAAGGVRHPRRDDRAALIRLFLAAFHGHVDSIYAPTLERNRAAQAYVDHVLGNSKVERIVREASFVVEGSGRRGGLVGAVIVRRAPEFTYVASLMVDPRTWRRGLGTHLLSEATGALARGGRRYVELMVSLQNPTRAIHLYRRMGFRPVRASVARRIPYWVRPVELKKRGIAFHAVRGEERAQWLRLGP